MIIRVIIIAVIIYAYVGYVKKRSMTWLGIQLLMSKFLLNSGHDNMQHLMSILLLSIYPPAMNPESGQEQPRIVRITPRYKGEIVHNFQNIKQASSDCSSIILGYTVLHYL